MLYKLQTGYQLDRNWALEGGYLDSNNANYSASGGNLPGTVTSSASVSGWNLTGIGILPLSNMLVRSQLSSLWALHPNL
jgi:OOP family OmpA-OmpF porin